MAKREAHVQRLLGAYMTQREEGSAGRHDSSEYQQAESRFDSARRNASGEEWDDFIERSLNHVLGPDWEQ